MNISEFAKQQKSKTEEKTKNNTLDGQQSIENLYDKYKNMSQPELMQTLSAEIKKQKQNGTFDYEKIMSSVNTIMPYLSAEQKNMITNILQTIK